MSLRTLALADFDLPAAPQRIDELGASLPGVDRARIHAPAGRFLLICSTGPLGLAFEATLFDLLAEAHYPAPRPRRAKGGSFVAPLKGPAGTAAAACYVWPPGDEGEAGAASVPRLLEVGRLLARLHQLGEAHPASVSDPAEPAALLPHVAAGPEKDTLAEALGQRLPSLPTGAVHGGFAPLMMLFAGDRASAVLPTGRSCAAGLLLDLCAAATQWAEGAAKPVPILRALFSGYQALRRLSPEELEAVPLMLRHAAAREGLRRAALHLGEPLAPLRTLDGLADEDLRAAAGG